ncbi:MAG: RNA polymerase sigma factor [Candidatus Jorgensenbacteria bacterium GW2011_GWA1_48_13]|uniref:RNA polymerase sigma factor n=1 Tax=Candidatus Jorgensenbacteria bacterium GW2011_GWB1_50_10 TaxID=1618665 RepID=A0A0G1W8C4_9BACT|nr:MAG: RNA polymerase sigma factor [Candidatus Jorgensenbacteria bacterium GW2011_GWA1_48_13]KKW14885.1 MAG: RNA polymerase sigma factor [Candidatus Jorgensenbacteria bacterium GW2011_GWB1_50_10]
MVDLDKFIAKVTADFSPKHRRVIEGRFGLKSGNRATLQKIGDELHITRERVRQIESQAVGKLKTRVAAEADSIIAASRTYLAGAGGIMRDDKFIRDLTHVLETADKNTKYPEAKIRFVLLVAGVPNFQAADDFMHGFWYTDEKARDGFLGFVKRVKKTLETSRRDEVLEKKVYLAECKDCATAHFLNVPRIFGVNVFGDFGLREWPEIEPKTVRDKAYLVLKKEGKPLHFSDIAKFITRAGLSKRTAHVQTVHNELIKDNRFVLVGRGIYALTEHGFEPGTVREVIGKLLKKKGPLSSTEVVRLVNQQRILKENTILLGLQNKRHFKRLTDGRYHIREA